jgi:hypothetical protein
MLKTFERRSDVGRIMGVVCSTKKIQVGRAICMNFVYVLLKKL